MEEKRKIFIINLVSMILLVMCLAVSGVLIIVTKSQTHISIIGESAEKLKNNYTTTEESSNTWDISATEDDSVAASLSSDGTLTISGSGAMKNWSYSSYAEWYSVRSEIKKVIIENGVTNIGDMAFHYCKSLTSIEIPSSVTSIGSEAFWYCTKLTNMETPSSVTSIGSYAFNSCKSLTSIEIPSSVTRIGYRAFNSCTNLTSIEVDENNTSYKDDNGVLYTKDGTKIIKYPEGKPGTEYIILSDTINIENAAFYYCKNLQSIGILSSVTSIENSAFESCTSLTSIEIPSSVTRIGYRAFNSCTNLTSIEVDENNTIYKDESGVLYSKDGKEIKVYPAGKKEIEYKILDGVTSIGGSAFENCTSLKSIEIPSSVTSIGNYAFSGCTSLKSIEIPSSVTSIGREAFYWCTGLTSIEIPSSVTDIGDNAFVMCHVTKLMDTNNSVELPDILKRTQDENDILYSSSGFEFTNCTVENNYIGIEDKESVAKIEVTRGKLYGLTYFIYNNTWDVSATENDNVVATFEDDGTLTIFGTGAMKSWSSFSSVAWHIVSNKIEKVIIENGVINIGDFSFKYCDNLTSVEMPNSVTSIGNSAFEECEKLASIEVDENNTSYKDDKGVLYTKDGTKIIKYPEGKDETKYSILNGVKIISDWAIYNTKLINIDIPDTVTYIGMGAFCYNINLANVKIPNSVKVLGEGAFYACENLTSVEILNGLISIDEYAFGECINLAKILIPNSVQNIGDDAFYNCTNVTIICISNSIAHIYAKEYDIDYLLIMDRIQPKTTVKQMEQEIGSASEYKIIDKNGEIITDVAYVTTGCKVETNDGENYIIIVTGDCNGDGQADIKDILSINKHRLNIVSLTMESSLSGDVNEDGQADMRDIFQINKFRLEKISEL